MNLRDSIETASGLLRASSDIAERFGGRGHERQWHVDKVLALLDSIETLTPLRTGDRVELIATPDLSDAPGWQCYASELVAGAAGKVDAIDFDTTKKRFRAGVVFDFERGQFWFWMDRLRRIDISRSADSGGDKREGE